MLKMKYLLALVLVALCVSFVSSAAIAQDSWAIATELWDDDDDPETPDVPRDLVDLPVGMGWDKTFLATVGALNDGTTTWDKASGYQLLSVEGTTAVGLVLTDRWGLTAVDLAAADAIAPDAVKVFGFTVTAPPVSGAFDCNWVMGKSSIPIETAMAAAEVLITRFPDTCGGTAGAWAASQIEGCAGLLPFIVQGYADGLYRPGVKVDRATMAVYIRRAMGIPQVFPDPAVYDAEDDEWTFYNTFPDVPYYDVGDPLNNWAVGDIEALAATMVDDDNDPDTDPVPVVAGFGDGTYQPTWDVYRSQMAKFVALGAMVPMPTDDELDAMMDPLDPAYDPAYFAFPDVPYGYWADNFIYALRDASIVLGYTDGFYRPGGAVDRGQLAVYCYRAFIGTTVNAVVLGGPAVTDVDLTTIPSSHGWTSATIDPDWAYIEFDAAAIGPELAGAGTWDIVFYFADVDTPTTVEDSAGVSLDAADLTGVTGDYFTVRADIPGMTPGQKIMWATVEDKNGIPNELTRTVTFELLEPPPPPGAPRPPNAVGTADWNALNDDDRAGGVQFSGTFSNMKVSDDSYYVMKNPTLPVTTWDDEDTECCTSSGFNLEWTGLEIPVAATEMKLTLEFHGGGTDLDQNGMSCCSNNMCEEWGSPWVDGVNVNYGWGLLMADMVDGWGGEIQDTPAEGGYLGAFAYMPFGNDPSADMVMTFTTNDWSNYVVDGKAMIHFCAGGSLPYLYIDMAMLEFSPLDP